jgi:hypothetical protein
MKWEGHVADTWRDANAYKISVENVKGRDLAEDLCLDERKVLE